MQLLRLILSSSFAACLPALSPLASLLRPICMVIGREEVAGSDDRLRQAPPVAINNEITPRLTHASYQVRTAAILRLEAASVRNLG